MNLFRACATAAVLKRFHGWMTVIWGILIPISVFTDLKDSIAWIVLMSVWANFVGHFSSWQATRVEVKQDESGPSDGGATTLPPAPASGEVNTCG